MTTFEAFSQSLSLSLSFFLSLSVTLVNTLSQISLLLEIIFSCIELFLGQLAKKSVCMPLILF